MSIATIRSRQRLGKGLMILGVALVAGLGITLPTVAQEKTQGPVKVTIKDEKPIIVEEAVVAVDPTIHAQVFGQGNMMLNIRVDNKMMHLGSIQTVLKVDNQILQIGQFPGRMLVQNQPLPQKPGKRQRVGFQSVYEIHKIQVTQTVEVVPTKAPKGALKRRLDAMLVTYQVENKDTQPHNFGLRVWMDMYIVTNDGALFAAPNKPNEILDGVELKGKDVPDYIQCLQFPNLQNPGFVGHFTYALGKKYERPDRVVMTALRGAFGFNNWDMQVFRAMGDSAYGFYWDPKNIQPGQKRQFAYGYGEGVVSNQEEGLVNPVLSGSFEPGKLFTVSAYVTDPGPGQFLTLQLPPGLELVEGSAVQPAVSNDESAKALVLWRCRVQRTGTFALRVRSSTGITQTRLITIQKASE
jgi:hypothetical protein